MSMTANANNPASSELAGRIAPTSLNKTLDLTADRSPVSPANLDATGLVAPPYFKGGSRCDSTMTAWLW
jgi:hypothetical protein